MRGAFFHDLINSDDEGGDFGVPVEPPPVVAVQARQASYILSTRIPPQHANHSFNGVLFDVRACGIETVIITGVVVGGEIGRYRIYSREGSHKAGFEQADGWTTVASGVERTNWQGVELRLARPVVVACGATAALFVHSEEPNDRGIAYQSYPSYEHVVCSDDSLQVFPGQARVGTEAFDEAGGARRWGWHRGPRGLAGSVVYRTERKRWTPDCHLLFPAPFRRVVWTLMLCRNADECCLSLLPAEIFLKVLESLDWRDWHDASRPLRGRRASMDGSSPLDLVDRE